MGGDAQTGNVVETGAVSLVFAEPEHEYTRMLLNSVPDNAAARTYLTKEGLSMPDDLLETRRETVGLSGSQRSR